ncbi:MAG: pitrilysin family protein [Candidatus Omnitrophota bacterium]
MKFKIKSLILCVVCAILLFVYFLPRQKVSLENKFSLHNQVYSLENDLQFILTQESKTPLVSAVLVIKTGAAVPPEFAGTGMAHLVEHMLFKANREYKGEEISRKFSAFGGYINAYTTYDYTAVHFRVLSEHLDEALGILSDMAFDSIFSVSEVETEKQVIANEINMGLDDAGKRLSRELFANAYQRSVYRFPVIGYKNVLMELTRDEIYDFYKSQYCPNNMVLCVAGNIQGEETKKAIEEHFGKYERKKIIEEAFSEEPPQVFRKRKNIEFPTPIAKIAMAYHSVDIFDEDLFALDMLSAICAGTPDSIMKRELVDGKRIAYSVNAYNYTPPHKGLFVITADCPEDRTDQVVYSLKKIVERLKSKKISKRQLSAAKNSFLADYYKNLETNEGLAVDAAVNYALAGDADFSAKYVEKIKKLTPLEVKKAAVKYLNDDNLTIVTLSKKARKQAVGEKVLEEKKFLEEGKPIIKELPGGLKIVFRKDESTPLVNFRVTYLGGLKDEIEPLWGVSNLTAALFFEGTQKHSNEEIDDLLSKWGASYSAYSGNNTFGFSIEALREYVEEAALLTREIMLSLSFEENQIEKQKRIIEASIEQDNSDVFHLGYLTLKEALYPKANPFAHSKSGDLKSLTTLKKSDVMDYYDKHLDPDKIVISVFGDTDYEIIEPYLKSISLELSKRKSSFSRRLSLDNKEYAVRNKAVKYLDKKQAMVMIGYKTIGIESDKRYALEILTKALSGSGERMYEKIREKKGFSYMLGAFNTYGLDEGFYTIYVSTTKENTEDIIVSVREELSYLKKEGITEEELERAKNAIIGEFLSGLETNSSFSLVCGLDELYGFGYDFYERYTRKIKEVTLLDVQNAAQKYFDDEKSAVVLILPVEKTREE